jgi:glycosyltransferase involved in cell wall biosynthesis
VSKLLKHFDVVHAANPLSSAAWFRAKADSNSRAFVTSIHGTALSELTAFVNTPKSEWTLGEFAMNVLGYPLNHHLIKICLENSDHVFVVGAATLRDTERSYLGWDRTRASVVRSGIDFEKFDGIQKDTVRRPQLIVYHGRLVSRKGVLHLVRAVAPLKKEFPALRLEIFGKGPLSDKVRHLVSDLNLKENVVLRGYVEYDKLIREICKASLVALPSLYEAQPISVLEAMACRKPVVVFDYPFSRECVVDSHNGLLAKPGDTQDLSEKIRLLLSNPEFSVELGENAYEFVRHRHDWKVLVEQYVRVYEALT